MTKFSFAALIFLCGCQLHPPTVVPGNPVPPVVVQTNAPIVETLSALMPMAPKVSARITPFISLPVSPPKTISLAWDDVEPWQDYELEYGTNSNEYAYLLTFSSSPRSVSITLSNSIPYWYFRLRKVSGDAISDWSNEARWPGWPYNAVELFWLPPVTNAVVEISSNLTDWVSLATGKTNAVATNGLPQLFFRTSATVKLTNYLHQIRVDKI